MTQPDAKADLQRYLQEARDALLWKLDGLPEYDIRRPLTPTGTHASMVVPLPGFECTSSWPFTSRTRSSMLRIPIPPPRSERLASKPLP